MVPFAGWNMPVQYGGITGEHLAVRSSAGIFDISHMGEFIVSGPGSGKWLNRLLTNNIEMLSPGQGHYTLLLNEKGGVIDDLIAYCIDEDQYFLVVNASKVTEDFEWLMGHGGSDLLLNVSDVTAGMAIQGPLSETIFKKVMGNETPLPMPPVASAMITS